MSRMRILGIGGALVDALLPVDDAFLRDHVSGAKGGMEEVSREEQDRWIRLSGKAPARAAGGAANNTMMVLGHLGAGAAVLAKVGQDPDGDFYRSKLLESGVEDHLQISRTSGTGRCLSMVTPDGERTMRTCLAASAELVPEEIDSLDFDAFELLYLEGYMLFNAPAVQRIRQKIRGTRCRLAMDLASFEVVKLFREQILEMIGQDVGLVFANEEEAAVLTGPGKSAEVMTMELGKRCHVAAVKRGPQGSCIVRDGRLTVEHITPVRAVDTTAAGDSWAAGYLYGYMAGKPDAVSARIASMVSAEIVQVYGSELPENTWKNLRSKIGEL